LIRPRLARGRKHPIEQANDGLFSALQRYPTFRRLWFGSVLAQLGQWMQTVALGWIALDLTDSAFFVGLVSFMSGIPFIIVAVPAGVLIDRFDRRQVLLFCQGFAGILAVVMAIDVMAGTVEPWHLLIAAFLNGSLLSILTPTQQAITPALVAREDLTNAIGLTSAGGNATRVIGPSIAGAIIGVTSAGPAFLVQAIALAFAFILISRTTFPAQIRGGAVKIRQALDGMAYVLRRDDLRALFLLAVIPNLFTFPYIQFLNVYARDVLDIGAGGLGLLMACSGSGAVVGSLVVAGRRSTKAQGRALILLTIAYGLVIVGVSASRHLPMAMSLLFIGGFLGSCFMSQNNALVQHRVTDDVRGRVMAAYMLVNGLLPLGAMPMGVIAGAISVPIAIAIGASLTVLLTLILGFRAPVLRTL
jgi:MFS family permease